LDTDSFDLFPIKNEVMKIHKTTVHANNMNFWCKLHVFDQQIQPFSYPFTVMFDPIMSVSTGELSRIRFSFSVKSGYDINLHMLFPFPARGIL